MTDLSLHLAALMVANDLDHVVLSADDLAEAQHKAIHVAPGFNGSLLIEARDRDLDANLPVQGSLFEVGG